MAAIRRCSVLVRQAKCFQHCLALNSFFDGGQKAKSREKKRTFLRRGERLRFAVRYELGPPTKQYELNLKKEKSSLQALGIQKGYGSTQGKDMLMPKSCPHSSHGLSISKFSPLAHFCPDKLRNEHLPFYEGIIQASSSILSSPARCILSLSRYFTFCLHTKAETQVF